jgi:hypothetical protein
VRNSFQLAVCSWQLAVGIAGVAASLQLQTANCQLKTVYNAIEEIHMTHPLTTEQQSLIDVSGTPLRFVDPRTGHVYILVDEQSDLAETYRAQIESAMRAGWDDPALDDYARYDELKQP